jgi:ABC-type Fe3+-siderophore transport system permease subunit
MVTQPFAIPALAFFILSIPLAIGFVPRNRLYGFRTRRTLADDAAWYPVNRFAGFGIMIASAIYGLVATARPYDRDFSVWLLHLAAFAGPLMLAIIVSVWFSRR